MKGINLVRVAATILYYLVFVTAIQEIFHWVEPTIFDTTQGRRAFVFIGGLATLVFFCISEIREPGQNSQGLRSDFLDFLFGKGDNAR